VENTVNPRNSTWICFVAALLCLEGTARADWTLNLGYHNPPVAVGGLNLLHFGNNWAFEVGVGLFHLRTVDTDARKDDDAAEESNEDDADDSAELGAVGDLNLKYLFGNSLLRPYLQGGVLAALWGKVGKDSGLTTGMGSLFAGGGLFIGKPKFYTFGSVNTWGVGCLFYQAGLGFDI
jgi:hypothetical protein